MNPFIYLFFNKNLFKLLMHYCCRIKINEDLNKTNASEMNSNYNYENRDPSQSSFDDENKKNSTLPLCHRSDINMSSKRQNHQNFRTRRSSIRRKNCNTSNI